MAVTLVVFCGKGGVGKSTLSVAAGLALSRLGNRTLVVSSHPLPELALSMSLEGLEEREPDCAGRLFVIHLDPKQVLDGLVRSRIRPGRMADLVVDSRVYRNFIEVVPGLKEFAFLWRLTDLGTANDAPRTAYDVIVWDAPASGHFLQALRVARNFEQFFAGPLASQGGRIRDFLERSCPFLVPVCLAEEMSVDETLELDSGLRELGMKSGAAVCNLASPYLAGGMEAGRSRDFGELPDYSGLGEWSHFVQSRVSAEVDQYGRLCRGLDCPVLVLERRPRECADLAFLGHLAQSIAEAGLLKLMATRTPEETEA